MGRPQLGFPRLRFVAVTAIGIAMALIILRRGALAFFFCPPPSTRPRIPVISPSQERSRMPTTNSSASTARCSSIKSFPLSITRKATLSARTAEARRSSSAGRPSPPSRQKTAHECAVARPGVVVRFLESSRHCGGATYASLLSPGPGSDLIFSNFHSAAAPKVPAAHDKNSPCCKPSPNGLTPFSIPRPRF
jgi:hypothetical protein